MLKVVCTTPKIFGFRQILTATCAIGSPSPSHPVPCSPCFPEAEICPVEQGAVREEETLGKGWALAFPGTAMRCGCLASLSSCENPAQQRSHLSRCLQTLVCAAGKGKHQPGKLRHRSLGHLPPSRAAAVNSVIWPFCLPVPG